MKNEWKKTLNERYYNNAVLQQVINGKLHENESNLKLN